MPIDGPPDSAPQFAAYLAKLWRRKWTVLLSTAVAAGAAFGVSKSETPVYSASAKVVLQPGGGSTALGTPPVANIADEIQRLESPAVSSVVAKEFGTPGTVAGSSISGTDVMVVTSTAPTAAGASMFANAYANAYISVRQAQTVSSYLAAAKAVQSQIAALQAKLAALSPGLPGTTNPQASAPAAQLTLLEQQLETLQTSADASASQAQVLAPANPPPSPSSPRTIRNLLLGLGGGLLLGVGLAFVRDSLDDTISSREDLEASQPGLPLLATIPSTEGRGRSTGSVVSLSRPHSGAAEAYRALRTSAQFLALDQPLRVIQVTSPKTGEGKTTTAANLAVAFAAAGQRVVAVDCDLRRSTLHQVFGVANEIGFCSVLSGDHPLSAALQEVPSTSGLRLLPSGPRPTNPAELLAGVRTGEVIAALAEMADVVIVDSPPVLPVTDASLISASVDATLVVVSSGSTGARDLRHALETLGQVDAPVRGTVLNRVALNPGYSYGYVYTAEPRHVAGGKT